MSDEMTVQEAVAALDWLLMHHKGPSPLPGPMLIKTGPKSYGVALILDGFYYGPMEEERAERWTEYLRQAVEGLRVLTKEVGL